MQNDLISRKVIMEYLQEQQANVIIERHKNGFVSKEVCDGMESAINAFINFIVQCPIDYNVEKVVEQIQRIGVGGECRNYCEKYDWTVGACTGECTGYVIGKVLEIVRNGGKE